MTRMWSYTLIVLGLWIVNPGLKRVIDWQFGASQVSVLSLIPLLALIPHLWSLSIGGGWQRLPPPLFRSVWLWLGAFGYAYIIGIVNGNLLPGTYAFVNFVFPIGLGLWIAASGATLAIVFKRIGRFLLLMTTIISAYGIVQFVLVPPWDAAWLHNAIAQHALSFGLPIPFQIRVFSLLNSPGPFGNFMAVMLLFALPQLSLRRPWSIAQIPVWLVAFGLSLDRTGWLMFAIGLLIYGALAPRRTAFLATIATSLVLLGAFSLALPAIVGNDLVTANISERLTTLSDVTADRSANEREQLYATELEHFQEVPFGFGRGLGTVGTATKLSDAAVTNDFDSGILARLIEMGFPGFALFGASLATLFGMSLKIWRNGKAEGDGFRQSVGALAISVEVGLLALEFSGDVSGVLLLALWLVVGVAGSAYQAVPERSVRLSLLPR